jgi:hypothetical protein
MRTFEVEDDLVALVWARANPKPFEHLSFSDALRRVLDVPKIADTKSKKSAEELLRELDLIPDRGSRKRAPKADLRTLVQLGSLQEGQELMLVDYRRQVQREFRAHISGGDLSFEGKISSMSALAELLLKRKGYVSDSVRGPDHWATADGKLISEHWQEFLASNGQLNSNGTSASIRAVT